MIKQTMATMVVHQQELYLAKEGHQYRHLRLKIGETRHHLSSLYRYVHVYIIHRYCNQWRERERERERERGRGREEPHVHH